jgi:hypothetical protein
MALSVFLWVEEHHRTSEKQHSNDGYTSGNWTTGLFFFFYFTTLQCQLCFSLLPFNNLNVI